MPPAQPDPPPSGPVARRARGSWRIRLGVAAVLALAVGSDPAAALDPSRSINQYNVRTWRRANMLPSNAVNAIVQSSDGHLWLGTPRGLVDFDGVEFKALGLPGQDESRPHIVASLAPCREGGLWVGTERGGYGRFDGARFALLPDSYLGGEFPTCRSLLEARDGALFISTQGTVGRRLPTGQEQILSPELDVLCMHEDAQGRVWMGTAGRGLYYWANGRFAKVDGPAAELWGNNVISAVTVDREGTIWVGASNGLHSLNPDLTPRLPAGFNAQSRALLVDSHGILWIGGMFDGLVRYKDGALSALARRDGLASDHVLALAESADGSLWIGTEDGLSQLSEVKFPILSTAEGLKGDACLSVAAAPDGGIWAGTSNGLTRIVNGRCTSFGVNRADGFPSEWIRRVHVVRNGDVYFLGGRQDFNRLRDGRVDKTWYPGTWSQAIEEDAQGVLITVNNKLARVVNDELAPYRLADGREPEFGWITELLVARDGSLWVAAKSGLAQIHDGVLHDWMSGRSDADQSFFNLCEDDQGAVWASRNSGLVRVKAGRISTVDHRQGLHSDLVYAIVPDLLGNFWMDSPEGFFRVNQPELNAVADGTLARITCTVFDGAHVIKTSEKLNSEYSGCRSLDGRIWLPSAKGVIEIDPSHLPLNSQPPPTRLQRVLVNGREYPVDQEPALEAGARNLEFDYAAIDYQAPERIRYRYRLGGYQDGWVDAGPRRSAFFTNLPPGRYRFQVQACNADGVWNNVGASFNLTLPRYLHEYWWFRLGLGAAGLGVIAAAWAARDGRRRREIAVIRHREELQMQMIESSPVPMVMLDLQHRVLYANATFTRVFGYAVAEIPDLETWWRLASTDPATREEWATGWSRRIETAAASGRSIDPVEATVAHKDGSRRHIVITTSAVGERTLVICTDLTDRKRAEDEQRRLEEQLRQSQKMEAIGRLSGGVAHDFNNLLTVILGNVMLLEMDGKVPADFAESIREIKEAATRAANFTRQLLAFSRQQPLHPTGIDLNHVVQEMTRMLQRLVGEHIQMELTLPAGIVPTRADTTMIEQVVLNLVLNARDAMPRGGRLVVATAVVDVATAAVPPVLNARAGRFACLTVSDTGTGIRPEVLPRIFEPFFTTKDVGKGTGLGLATVFGIVDQHRGWIDVASEVDRGSTFRIYLPVDTEALPAPAQPELPPTRPPPSPGRVILLVEDDSGVRALARKTLLGQGHRVLEAASGPLALEVWRERHDEIEILLTDVVMPDGLNGIELARRLLAEKPALKVIYASGYSAEVSGGDFSGREGLDFLGKPYTPANLLRIVERAATGLSPAQPDSPAKA